MPADNPAAAPIPPPTSPYADLEAEVRLLFRRAGAVAAATARRVHPDLDASAYPLLAQIAERPGVRGSELADHFGVGRATISRQLGRLHDLGLVARDVDPEDSRGQLITLTDDGEQRLRAAHAGRIASLEEVLADWSRDDVTTLATLLRRYSTDVTRWKESR